MAGIRKEQFSGTAGGQPLRGCVIRYARVRTDTSGFCSVCGGKETNSLFGDEKPPSGQVMISWLSGW